MKKIIIITGMTGSIGQEILRKYLVEEDVLVYGISRKGVLVEDFATLPEHNLIVAVDLNSKKAIKDFVSKIPFQHGVAVTYFHLVGEFKTEINTNLGVAVENDHDGDGIDDTVKSLVADAYITMVSELSQKLSGELNVVSFGSLADTHELACFHSFRKSREIVKAFSREVAQQYKNVNFYLFNTSTILAADEMLERPFIFATNVNPKYWITPLELTTQTFVYMNTKGFVEEDIYIKNPSFTSDYFTQEKTYVRRVKELYNKDI